MTPPSDGRGTPLPEFPSLSTGLGSDHPVLAAVLAELRDRVAGSGEAEPVVAYYEDAP
ncbi:hypothetical protein AB0C51_19720 [Streptomyces pathocidini]|uniref:hypothetical protein n=1 Tax=Streptomyces pathocidini TaxID=1650571 RepID=UPI003400AC49